MTTGQKHGFILCATQFQDFAKNLERSTKGVTRDLKARTHYRQCTICGNLICGVRNVCCSTDISAANQRTYKHRRHPPFKVLHHASDPSPVRASGPWPQGSKTSRGALLTFVRLQSRAGTPTLRWGHL